MKKIKVFTLLSVIYAIFLFYLSSLPTITQTQLFHGSDKVAHFAAYAFFGFLVASALREWNVEKRVWLWGFLIVAVYGVSDEIHQYFVTGRDCSILDLTADAAGALCGVFFKVSWLLKLFTKRYRRKK